MRRITSGWQFSVSLVELLGLTMWIGGLTVILVAIIPAVFSSLGMETGGRFLRRVFDNYNLLTSAVLMVLIATTSLRAWANWGSSDTIYTVTRFEVGILTGMAVVTVLIVFVLGPQAIQLQEAAFSAKGELAKKTAYEAFFRTHMLVRGLHLINVGLAISLLVIKFRRWIGYRGSFGMK